MTLIKTLLILLLSAAALNAAPTDESRRLYNEANTQYLAKEYDKALSSYGSSLRIDNSNVGAYQGVGNCYVAKGENSNALKYYNYALQLKPNDGALTAIVGRLRSAMQPGMAKATGLYKDKRYDEALAAYQALADAEPNNAKVRQGMGNSLYALGRKEEAIAAFKKSLELDPSNAALQNFVNAASGKTSYASAGNGPSGDWFGSAWRSMILPGWGQGYNGETGKGWVLGGLTFAMIGGEVATYMAGNQAMQNYSSYTDPGADYDGQYKTWETMAGLNHAFFIGSTAFYSWALVDAIWGSQKPSMGATKPADPAFKVGLSPTGGYEARLALAHF